MSYAGIVMDVVLMALLVAALLFGVRLDKRLKGLRAAHDSFARAVADLDQAAIKAHSALRELHSGTDESQELLHGRILVARDLLAKLESQIARAEKAERDIGRHVETAKDMVQAPPPTRPVKPQLTTMGYERPDPEPPKPEVDGPERDGPEVDDLRLAKPEHTRRLGALRAERPSPFKGAPFKGASKPKVSQPADDEAVPHISENVLASLNDMLRAFDVPKPESLSGGRREDRTPHGRADDDLFDTPSEPPVTRRRARF